jgi:thioredoxin-related protein
MMRYWIKSLSMIGLALFSLWAVFSLWADSTPSARAEGDSGTRQQALFAHTTLDRAWKTAVEHQRPMLVLFSTESCHYCTKMLAETYSHPKVQQLLRGHVEMVKVNAQEYPALIERLGIRGYPTTLLVSPKGNVLDAVEGFAPAATFADRIGPLLKAEAHATSTRVGTNTARTGRVGS